MNKARRQDAINYINEDTCFNCGEHGLVCVQLTDEHTNNHKIQVRCEKCKKAVEIALMDGVETINT